MLIGLDTETHLIVPGTLAPKMVCVSWDGAPGFDCNDSECDRHHPNTWSEWDDPDCCYGYPSRGVSVAEDGALQVAEWLEQGHILVLHNAAFDMAVLAAYEPGLLPLIIDAYKEGRIKDTKIRQQLMDIAKGRKSVNGQSFVVRNGTLAPAKYSLADLEALYFDRDRYASKTDPHAWRLRYSELDGVPIDQWPQEAYDYALDDASGALEVYHSQAALNGGPVATEDEQARADFSLHLAACWGMRTDSESVLALEAALLKEAEKNNKRIKQAGFQKSRRATKDEVEAGKVDFWEDSKRGPRPMRIVRDMAAIQSYVTRVYERKGLEVPTTDTGKISTSKDTCYESGSRLLKAVADGGGVDKLLNTYVPVLKRGMTTPINPAYQVLVNSGRTSCREPNYQNLPSGRRKGGVRECHVPSSPSMVYSSTDYSTVELRTLAQTNLWWQGYSKMAEALNAKQDLHLAMAASMMRTDYVEAKAAYDSGDKEVKRYRNLAKIANFGLPGGLGVASLIDFARTAYGVRLTETEARRIKEEWVIAWPEMKGYFKHINDLVGYGEARVTHEKTGYTRGMMGYTEACNHFFQHLAAMGAKRALFNLTEEMYVKPESPLFGSRLVAFIHDEFICEHPEDRAHEAAWRVSEVACAAMSEVVPDIEIVAEPALMRRWYKEAAKVTDPTGTRLIPWEPDAKYDNEGRLIVAEAA